MIILNCQLALYIPVLLMRYNNIRGKNAEYDFPRSAVFSVILRYIVVNKMQNYFIKCVNGISDNRLLIRLFVYVNNFLVI